MNIHLTSLLRIMQQEKGLASQTLQSYRRDLEQYLSFLQERNVAPEDSSRVHVQGYLLHLRRLERAAATISRNIVSIRKFYQHLVKEQIITINPAIDLETPKPERRLPAVLSVEEIGRLLDAPGTNSLAGLRDKAMLELLYATGMRVTELVSLNREHVYLDLGFIRCSGRGHRERLVPIHAEAADWLRQYLGNSQQLNPNSQQGGSSPLFCNHQGGRLSRQGFWKIIKKYGLEAGIPVEITPHILRHSFAVHLLDNGADLKAVQEMLGHADIASTTVYARSNETRMKDVYNQSHPRARKTTNHKGGEAEQ